MRASAATQRIVLAVVVSLMVAAGLSAQVPFDRLRDAAAEPHN